MFYFMPKFQHRFTHVFMRECPHRLRSHRQFRQIAIRNPMKKESLATRVESNKFTGVPADEKT